MCVLCVVNMCCHHCRHVLSSCIATIFVTKCYYHVLILCVLEMCFPMFCQLLAFVVTFWHVLSPCVVLILCHTKLSPCVVAIFLSRCCHYVMSQFIVTMCCHHVLLAYISQLHNHHRYSSHSPEEQVVGGVLSSCQLTVSRAGEVLITITTRYHQDPPRSGPSRGNTLLSSCKP